MTAQYIPQVDNFNAIEAFVRRVYNPSGDPTLDAKISIQPYAYRAAFADLLNGTSPQQVIQIAANADFVLTSPRYRAVVDNVVDNTQLDAPPLVRILLTDTGSQEQLMSEAVDLTTYFGHIRTAQFEIQYPRIISGRSGMSVQVTNYSNILTTPQDYKLLELTFAGVLVRGF